MSDPIRKVGGSSAPPVGETTGGGGDGFRATLDASREIEAGAPTAAAGPLRELTEGLRSGALEPSAVIDRLVERALAAPGAQGLTEPARADLERALRSALAEDPTLLAMQSDLGRG